MRPMLAAKLDWDRLRYPTLVSPKVDGIRCIVENGLPYSRTSKILPNRSLRAKVNVEILEGLDGEIVVGSPTDKEVYNKTMSGVMSQMGSPNFTYLVFDIVTQPREPYATRLKQLLAIKDKLPPWVYVLEQTFCKTRKDVEQAEERHLAAGYEGVIVRSIHAPYKFNRSTATEGYLLKLKRYSDSEALIIGFDELEHNDNEGYLDAQGFTRHTSHKANQRKGGVLGALRCQLLSDPSVVFGIGTGFDWQQRTEFWKDREQLKGRIVKFKHLPYGALESTGAPRHPVFLGFRDPIDL